MVRKRTFVPGSEQHLARQDWSATQERPGNNPMTLVFLGLALMASAVGFSMVGADASAPSVHVHR